ncbi:MAG: inner membrane CreD family protein [Treponema sp.]|nr:inner membrane CreD family protein [Treponema sp.]
MKKISPFSVKLIFIGFIVIILLIGNVLINSKLEDREYSYRSALKSIEESGGGRFDSRGPFIVIPYEETVNENIGNNKVETKTVTRYELIHPEILRYDSDLTSERRTLGIYSSPVFSGTMRIHADFEFSERLTSRYRPEDAFILLEISDRSLQSKPVFIINGEEHSTYLSGTQSIQGLASQIDLKNGKYTFDTELKIQGSTAFAVEVSASDTSLSVKSDWASPGFTGFDYLPNTRNLTDEGFTAEWTLPFANDYSRHQIGFYFIDPVNVYQKLDRAISYGFLFIIVPFIVLFMFEAIAKVNLHPVHYLLSGSACVLFFLLLLALSEHCAFYLSYITGSLASGLLVSVYIGQIAKKWRFSVIMAGCFALLYSYLYLSLQSEDYALLIGSVFAFVVVAVLMFFTRNGIIFHRDNAEPAETTETENRNS